MKIVFSTAELRKAIRMPVRVAPPASLASVNTGIMLSPPAAGSDRIAIHGEGEQARVTSMARFQNVVGFGEPIWLPAGRAASIMSVCDSEEVSISRRNSTVTIQSGRNRFALQTMDASGFRIADAAGDSPLTVKAEAFRAAMTQTAYCADEESSRYALKSIKLECEDGVLRAIATDGRRAAVSEHAGAIVGDHSPIHNVLLSPVFVRLAMDATSKCTGDATVSLSFTNSSRMETADWVIESPMVEGRYPAWQKLLEMEGETNTIETTAGVYRSHLEAAAVTSDEDHRGIVHEITAGRLRLSNSSPEVGETKIELPVETYGELKIMIDHRYLIKPLTVLDRESPITMHFYGDKRAMIMQSGGFRYLAMPMVGN